MNSVELDATSLPVTVRVSVKVLPATATATGDGDGAPVRVTVATSDRPDQPSSAVAKSGLGARPEVPEWLRDTSICLL